MTRKPGTGKLRNVRRKRAKMRALLERDGDRCWVCGIQTVPWPHPDPDIGGGAANGDNGRQPPDARTLDHIVPTSKGGRHGLDNLRIACNRCNLKRGNKRAAAAGAREDQKAATARPE